MLISQIILKKEKQTVDINDKEFADSFVINLYLANLSSAMSHEFENVSRNLKNWNDVPVDTQNAINNITLSIHRALELSNRDMKKLENKEK